jgi:hypothetical protein
LGWAKAKPNPTLKFLMVIELHFNKANLNSLLATTAVHLSVLGLDQIVESKSPQSKLFSTKGIH